MPQDQMPQDQMLGRQSPQVRPSFDNDTQGALTHECVAATEPAETTDPSTAPPISTMPWPHGRLTSMLNSTLAKALTELWRSRSNLERLLAQNADFSTWRHLEAQPSSQLVDGEQPEADDADRARLLERLQAEPLFVTLQGLQAAAGLIEGGKALLEEQMLQPEAARDRSSVLLHRPVAPPPQDTNATTAPASSCNAEQPNLQADDSSHLQSSPVAASPALAVDGARDVDDLQNVAGIDADLAQKLRDHGEDAFGTIAVWTAADVSRVAGLLGIARRRIAREGWIEQAAILAAGRATHFSRRRQTDGAPVPSPRLARLTSPAPSSVTVSMPAAPRSQTLPPILESLLPIDVGSRAPSPAAPVDERAIEPVVETPARPSALSPAVVSMPPAIADVLLPVTAARDAVVRARARSLMRQLDHRSRLSDEAPVETRVAITLRAGPLPDAVPGRTVQHRAPIAPTLQVVRQESADYDPAAMMPMREPVDQGWETVEIELSELDALFGETSAPQVQRPEPRTPSLAPPVISAGAGSDQAATPAAIAAPMAVHGAPPVNAVVRRETPTWTAPAAIEEAIVEIIRHEETTSYRRAVTRAASQPPVAPQPHVDVRDQTDEAQPRWVSETPAETRGIVRRFRRVLKRV